MKTLIPQLAVSVAGMLGCREPPRRAGRAKMRVKPRQMLARQDQRIALVICGEFSIPSHAQVSRTAKGVKLSRTRSPATGRSSDSSRGPERLVATNEVRVVAEGPRAVVPRAFCHR